jgi:zinc transporter ZupT
VHGGAPELVHEPPVEGRLRVRSLRRRRGAGRIGLRHGLAAIPVLGLAVLIAALLVFEPIQSVTGSTPVDSLSVERTTLEPGQIELHVRNDGRVDTTVAQVLVNDAYWDHEVEDRELGRFEGTEISLSYPWEEGIPLHLAVLTGAGTVVEHVIDNPAETVRLDGGNLATLGWLGLVIAPIPVALGLAWLPALRRASRRVLGAVMAFTVGLLAFLLVDSAAEGLESAADAPGILDGVALFAVGALVALVAVAAAGTLGRSGRPGDARPLPDPSSPGPAAADHTAGGPVRRPVGADGNLDPPLPATHGGMAAGKRPDGGDGNLHPPLPATHGGMAAGERPDGGDGDLHPPLPATHGGMAAGERPDGGDGAAVPPPGVVAAAEGPPDGGGRAGGAPFAGNAVRLAWLVAAGIGLHNLGEGLAVGAAINAGEVALGTALVVGFALHNVTEGVAIAGPLGTSARTRTLMLVGLVALAGLPVFPGLWLGGFVLPAGWAALAFGVAAGAIAEVLWSVVSWLRQRGVTLTPLTAGAFATAVLFMYVTALAAS